MIVLSPERMAKYDRYAIDTWGMPSTVLMENAGRSTYRLMKDEYLAGGTHIAVVCGRGNNGGDGFVVGRYALRDGYPTKVYLLARAEELKGDAALNMKLYTVLGGQIVECGEDAAKLREGLDKADIIVDAVFGTGLSKAVEGVEKEAIEAINEAGKPVIAIDIPSGIDGKTGLPLGAAVRAAHTYTYGWPKLGQVLYPGAYHTGKLTVIDISIPASAQDTVGVDGHIIDGDMLRGFLRERKPWEHKGTFGHTAVIAGSVGKTGAAAMASLAALKIGAGLVTLLTPESLNAIMEVKLTEVMTYPLDDAGKGHFLLSSYEKIVQFLEDKDVVIMGPGLSQNQETMELVRQLYGTVDKPFVIDADGINAFQGHLDVIQGARRGAVFTPHPGELARLMGVTPKEINEDRIGWGKRFVEENGADLVLKGARTLIFGADGEMFICPTGNPALAKGGSGDILTGFVGGMVSQGYSLIEASLFGTYLHGYIADTWAEQGVNMDLLAADLLDGLGEAIREIRDGEDRVYIEKSL
jgi:ADP-dependent NAD(P)H-hydrate dehydratase / NAD(P)H-hydrate epimerase